ncbi:MAG TPA: DUF2283 domain-containing protein [Ilumatobacter sp.]|nr:DUF2283 domain-containing protein [Ilumatobacter sp.]
MNYEFDRTADALYIRISNAAIDHQEEMDDGAIVDVDMAGEIVGIDVMSPDEGWDAGPIISRWDLSAIDVEMIQKLRSVAFSRANPLSSAGAGASNQLVGAAAA